MKKIIPIWFMLLIVSAIASVSMLSCKSKQNLTTNTLERSIESINTDTTEKTVINQAILDTFYLQLSQIYSSKSECDSLINLYRNQLAQSIVTAKHSGDNSYEVKYNEALKRLEFLIKIGQTENKDKATNTNTKTTYTLEKTVKVPVKLPLTWWEKLFYWIGIGCSSVAGLMIVFFALKSKFN